MKFSILDLDGYYISLYYFVAGRVPGGVGAGVGVDKWVGEWVGVCVWVSGRVCVYGL